MAHRRIQVVSHGVVHTVNPLKGKYVEILWVRQLNGRCIWCGCQMVRKTMRNSDGSMDPYKATIDHIVPQAAGGSDDISNLVLACFACNQLRGENNTLHFGPKIKKLETNIGILVQLNKKYKERFFKTQAALDAFRKLSSDRLLETIAVRERLVYVQEQLKIATRPACTSFWCRWIRKICPYFSFDN